MNSEFLRMQKLAGVKPVQENYNEIVGILTEVYLHNHYYSKGILKEDITGTIKSIGNNIKNIFKKVSPSNQKFIKNIVDLIKSKGDNPVNVLTQLGDFIKQSGGIKQALSSLKDSSPSDNIQEIKLTDPMKRLKKKYGSLAVALMLTAAGSTIGQTLINATSGTIDKYFKDAVTYVSQIQPGLTFLPTSDSPDQRGVFDFPSEIQPIDDVNDASDVLSQLQTPTQSSQSQADIENDFDNNNVNVGDADLSPDDNTVVSYRTYGVGEYELDDNEKDEAASDIVNKILKKIKQDLEDNPDKKVESIKISKKIFDAISNQGDKDSNVADDGSDLGKGRLSTERDINDKVDSELESSLKQLKSQGIKIEITDTDEIDTHDSAASQKIQTAQDGLTTQSSGTTVDVDIEYGEKGKEADLVLRYIPLYYDPNNGETPTPSSDGDKKQGAEDNKPETSQDTPPPVPTDSGMDKDITTLPSLSRNNQIALLLSRTNPSLSLYKALGLDNVVNIPDGDYNSIATQGTYKGEPVSDNAKKLASIIIASRKSPDTLIKAYAKITDLKPGQNRAKASITTGAKGKSASAPIKENLSILIEAAIDNLISNSKPTDINQAAFLAKLVNAIYNDNVLDPDSHNDPDFKPAYDKIKTPLGSKEKGERYVYLDKKQGVKIQPDITRVDKAIEADKPLMTVLSRINTQDELASLLTALFIHKDKKGQSVFPDDKTFTTDSGKVRSALFGLNYRLKEVEEEELPFDVKDFYSRIDKSPNLKAALSKINSLEEFYQFILYTIFPRINKSLIQDKTKLKAAIAKAANASKQFSEKGKYNVDENLIKEESTQYNTEGLLLTNTEIRPQKDILSDIRSITGVTIVSSKDYKLAGEESTAFSNPNYYSIIRIKIDPHPYPGGFKDKDLDKMLTNIRAIKGVRNFKLTKSVEKTTV
jgi:hypothetical protein